MAQRKQSIVILAAGDYPTHPEPLRALREADFVVCCDSAYTHWQPQPGLGFIVIGDGDSLPQALKESLGSRWVQVGEQNFNDLHKAMHWVAAHFPPEACSVTIVGATGRREDHTLGNISYLVTFAQELPAYSIAMLTDHGRFCAFRGACTLPTFARQQVSIFSFDPTAPVSGSGLRWPLDGLRVRLWWQATLNEALGSSVELHSEGWIVVFLTFDAK